MLMVAATLHRSTEYDENYSVFVTGGLARPDWSSRPFTAAGVATVFTDQADVAKVNHLMRTTDVHPPLYFWALSVWRNVAGSDLSALRGFSIIFALATLLVWMQIAWVAGLPPLILGSILALSYGFEITSHIVRGYALAQFFLALAVWAAIVGRSTAQRSDASALVRAGLAGLAGGLACFTHYFAVFPVAVILGWMVLTSPTWEKRFRVAMAAGLPCLLLVAAAGEVWLAQRAVSAGQAVGQFPILSPLAAAARLAQYNAASLLGGLPLYVPAGFLRTAVGGGLIVVLAGLLVAILAQWRNLGPLRWLWLFGAIAPSLGLLPMGLLFGAMPIELRYLILSAPFVAALVAAAAGAWMQKAPLLATVGLGAMLSLQGVSAIGMVFHPATQQPFRAASTTLTAAISTSTLVLVPFGQDGVGIVGSMLREMRPDQPVLVLRSNDASEVVSRVPKQFCRLVLLGFGDRDPASAVQSRTAKAALDASGSWSSAALLWQEQRGGNAILYVTHDQNCWTQEASRSP